jgi:lysophospholipase L1-like esterase
MQRGTRISWLVVLLAAGAGCKKAETPTTPTPTAAVFYTAVAASDGSGFGGSAPCLPFDPDCPSGTGYVYLLKRRLQGEGREVTLRNLAVLGAVLSPAIQALSRDIGRDILSTFFDQASVVPSSTTHVTIFAGGNDTNVIAQNVRAGRGAADIKAFVAQHVNQWGADYEELIRRIRARAPSARIVAINLPNLGAAPYVSGNTVLERSIVQHIAVAMSDRVNALSGQNVLVVDLMCDPRVYDAGAFSSDGFHPNDRGYALMAEITYAALANGTATQPSSSCPQRSLLPVY